MGISTYVRGGVLRVAGDFKDAAGVYADPTSAVVFRFRKPDGTITAYTYNTHAQLVKDSTGRYHVDLTLDAAGPWMYRFEGTGTGAAAAEGQFQVKQGAFD